MKMLGVPASAICECVALPWVQLQARRGGSPTYII